MRYVITFFKFALVIGFELSSSRPLVAKLAIRGKKQSAHYRPRRSAALAIAVARDVIEITEEKAAKVHIGALTSADAEHPMQLEQGSTNRHLVRVSSQCRVFLTRL